jgi:hypothetical protein
MTTLAETAQVSENYITPLVIQGVHLQLQEYSNIIIPRDYALQESIRVVCVCVCVCVGGGGYLYGSILFLYVNFLWFSRQKGSKSSNTIGGRVSQRLGHEDLAEMKI